MSTMKPAGKPESKKKGFGSNLNALTKAAPAPAAASSRELRLLIPSVEAVMRRSYAYILGDGLQTH